jgi:hypothetical protein
MKDRAEEEWQKRDVMEKLLDVWLKHPNLRLGQLIINSLPVNGVDAFNVEDYRLVELAYKFSNTLQTGKK